MNILNALGRNAQEEYMMCFLILYKGIYFDLVIQPHVCIAFSCRKPRMLHNHDCLTSSNVAYIDELFFLFICLFVLCERETAIPFTGSLAKCSQNS